MEEDIKQIDVYNINYYRLISDRIIAGVGMLPAGRGLRLSVRGIYDHFKG